MLVRLEKVLVNATQISIKIKINANRFHNAMANYKMDMIY